MHLTASMQVVRAHQRRRHVSLDEARAPCSKPPSALQGSRRTRDAAARGEARHGHTLQHRRVGAARGPVAGLARLRAFGPEGRVGREVGIYVAPLWLHLAGRIEGPVRIVGDAPSRTLAHELRDPVAARQHTGIVGAESVFPFELSRRCCEQLN